MPDPKQLLRSSNNRMIAGVCGGLAEYFDTDPVLIRILFVVFALAWGAAVLLYLAMWLLIPDSAAPISGGHQPLHSTAYHGVHRPTSVEEHLRDLRGKMQSSHNHAHGFLGFLIIMFGVLILFKGFFETNLTQIIAIAAILFGIVLVVRRHDGQT